MHHLAAYFSAAQPSATLTAMAPVADQTLTIVSNDLRVPVALPYLLGVQPMGATLTRCQVTSPSMLRVFKEEIKPIMLAALPSSPHPTRFWLPDPIALVPSEGINVLITGTAGAGENDTVLVWLCDGPVQPVDGDIRTIRATGATTLVVNAWTAVPLTFDQSLPAGQYAVVGMRAQSTNMQAARLILPGQQWRPGCVGVQTTGHIQAREMRYGGLGEWGRFTFDAPPQAECIANVADTSEIFELDLIKVA